MTRTPRALGPAALAAAALVTACGTTPHTPTARPSAHTATVAAAPVPAQSLSCANQVHAWAHDQGLAQLHQLSSDTTALGRDGAKAVAALRRGSGAAGQIARWQAAATGLETDAQAAASNPSPACADAADYGTAMQDYTTAAKDEMSAASDISSGNFGAAPALITSAASAMQQGNSALARSNAALNALNG